ncbi:glycine oxidase ThiO [Thermoflavimicrobium dichotomicum]|uniref:glycine oxidase n=1 Tax=Thermoflavimicrobium dichotomicum TaxID=46223 RepID=A0A1I3NFS6_9BACL|nr:glycine oxidase ThiO [Thermoflavimicrobium dichotomicum]SFJ08019.1 glycine oxidase [Thermoflavimicrobium dichotomicum]
MNRDVLIIGGGVIGSSIAYYLAKQGVKVTVLERDRIAAHASSSAAGMLGAQSEMEQPDPLVDLCLASRSMFPQLQKELVEVTGIDIELNQAGLLKVATHEETAERLKWRGKWQREMGLEAIWFEPYELYDKEPKLASRSLGALYLPNDYQVSAPKLTRAFAQGAKQFGAEFIEHAEVIEVQCEKEQVVAVHTRTERYHADQVVIAAGIWSQYIAELCRVPLPMKPLKGESLAIKPSYPLIQHTIFAERCYLVPKADGQIIVGATEIPDEMSSHVTVKGVNTLLQAALELVPELAQSEWKRCWAGIRPGTNDGKPYLGKISLYSNLYVACGHRRNGILLAPITGKRMAQMIVDGSVTFDPAFRPERIWIGKEVIG